MSTKSRVSSWFSRRFKNRDSPPFSPSSPATPFDQRASTLSDSTATPNSNASSSVFPSAQNSPSHRHALFTGDDTDTSDVSQLPQGQASTYRGPGHTFGGAHHFVMKDPVFNDYTASTDTFMEKLLQETIIGAEFDSSARDPPPRCHPGTRLAIIQRCLDFIEKCHDEEKVRWVVGPAGVGKSAVLQMVTETAPDNIIFASIFFSINGRSDGKKTIITIAYQLAVRCKPYCRFIRDQISHDPSLLRKSLLVQFNKFIVEPFILKRVFEPSRRFLVVIDGLDECDNPLTQRMLLEVISSFCIKYPSSPIAWIVASRPEPHITAFFDRAEVNPVYTKEEIEVDTDEACQEVQQYLRAELTKIKLEHATLRLKREWPLEHEFTKIAASAGGLFAYASTVVRYIADSTHGGPAAQLRRVLEIIDASAKDNVAGRDHPMDRLDALYKRILSNVPDDVMVNTRKLLLLGSDLDFQSAGFRMRCNALRLTEDDAYDALRPLHAVMKIPAPDKADDSLSSYHKSFDDFLRDLKRSGFSHDFNSECSQLNDLVSLKIMEELQDGSDDVVNDADIKLWAGAMTGHCKSISLSWPSDERFGVNDEEMRTKLHIAAFRQLVISFRDNRSLVKSISCFHALTTHFTMPTRNFPFTQFQECAFDRFRDELTKLGELKQVPLHTLHYAAICGDVTLRVTSPTRSNTDASGRLHSSCKHAEMELDDFEQRQGWSTTFPRCYRIDPDTGDDTSTQDDGSTGTSQFPLATLQHGHRKWAIDNTNRGAACVHCSHRLERLLVDNSGLLATVFVDRTQMCYVEVSFVDPDDRVSEWRYRFLHSGRPSSLYA